jgi:hypothetical protein
MDTDDLTPMAYEMITMARDVLDDLRLEMGVAASDFRNEDAYLRAARAHLRSILRSATQYLDDHDCLEVVEIRPFRKGVKELLAHVEKTLATPIEERGKPPFE